MKIYIVIIALFFFNVNIKAQNNTQKDSCVIPTIITPNDDNQNDEFKIPCLSDNNTGSEILILNEWGDRVFAAKPYQNNWKGTYKNQPLPDGTYFYVFKMNAISKPQKGFITVFR